MIGKLITTRKKVKNESGRASQYFKEYGDVKREIIMDYKAYSNNQWYNLNMRAPGMRIDYSATIEALRKQLPSGWWKVK